MTTDATTIPASDTPLLAGLLLDLRKMGAAAAAGVVTGFVFLGWGSRLAMMLLARLNPEVTGRISDDGFRMGQFTLGDTLGLVAFCTFAGLVGGLVFLAIRQLRFGPAWFRTWSMIVGPAVVGGAILVHQDGIDFHVLDPAGLAIALFVLVPGLYAWAVMRLADHWLRDESWFLSGSAGRVALALPLLLLGPFLLGPLVVLGVRMLHRSSPTFRSMATTEGLRVAARVVLVGIFLVALVDLVKDTVALV